jgi:single-strand DNA-binding protein
MASYNRVVLVGNLTRDPELRYIPSGTAVSEVGLAVNDRVKRDGQWVEETTFVDVTLWARTAEIANEYLSRGSSVLIEGRLKLDSWENNEGQKRSKLRVVGERLVMLGGRGGGGGGGGNRGSSSQPATAGVTATSGSAGDSGGGHAQGQYQEPPPEQSQGPPPEQSQGPPQGPPEDHIPF